MILGLNLWSYLYFVKLSLNMQINFELIYACIYTLLHIPQVPSIIIVSRCALLITTLLVLVNIFNSVVATTPGDADGLTALVIWIIACILFTFFSLLSYVFILVRMKIPKKIISTENKAGRQNSL